MPTGEGWAYELKWDGMRIEALCPAGGPVTLRALSGRDVTTSFPELNDVCDALHLGAVLDGEVVVFDGDRPSFGRLQNRMHVDAPSGALVAQHPVVYLIFDLLALDGRSTVELPYHARRRLLADVVEPGPTWRVPPMVEGDGAPLLALARQRGLEGVVAKRLDSVYRPGSRTREWVKVKVVRRQEFVVVGWLPGQGRLEGLMGSLLLAVNDHGGLRFAGAVGSGLADRDRAQLAPLLVPTPQCPLVEVPPLAKRPTWVEPTVAVEVAYGTWSEDGLLRHPVYAGLRVDVDVDSVVRELPPAPPGVR